MNLDCCRILSRSFAASLLLCVASLFASAQSLDNVSFSGRVLDGNSAPVIGASVTAASIEKGLTRTTQTDEDGAYRLVELPPGTYTLTVEASGFAKQKTAEFTVIAAQNVRQDFTVAVSSVSAETTVEADSDNTPAVDTTRTIVGGTVTGREIEELPINSRNPLDLVLTLGGTSEEALSTRDLAEDRNVTNATAPAEQGNFSLSGGVSYSNNITIDGLDNNDDRSANVRFQPSLETVEEVQVITNQFSAEYGRASGGRINLRTKSGTNRLRGRVFMFFRDDNLNANSWYNNLRKYSPIPPLTLPDTNPLYNRLPFTEYNPGFTLSGPVVLPKIYNGRNKTFFAFGYEYGNLQDTTLISTWVPTVSNPNFALPAGTGNCPLASCLDANSSITSVLAPYTKTFSTPNVNHIFTAKLDQVINERNNFTVGYQLGRRKNRRTTAASVTRLDDTLQARTTDSDAVNFTDNHVFNARTVNQFRFQYSIFEPSYQTDTPDAPVILIGYRNPETNTSQTLIVGNSTASGDNSETFPQNRRETRFQYQDTLTYLQGKNTFKGGFDIQTISSKAKELADSTGTFNFANTGTFQQNTLSRFRMNFGTGSNVKNTYWSLFINDELKLLPNLTLNLGLRYERETTVDDKNNFGPRLGVAWNPFKQDKTVVRVGAGIFYNRTLLRTVADSIQNVNGIVPFDTNAIGTGATDNRRIAILNAIARRFPKSFASESELRALVANACAGVSTTLPCSENSGFLFNFGSTGNPLRSVDSDLKIPESYQLNIGFEREIYKGWVFETNYTWNKTIRLWRDRNINAPVLPSGYADWTAYLTANPFTLYNANGSVARTYRFYAGNVSSLGVTTAENGTSACVTSSTLCFVNLNTLSISTTAPSVAVAGSVNNSVGGAIGIALAAISRFRPDPNFEEKSRIGSIGKAFYHGAIFEIRSRYKKYGAGFGGNLRFNYTLSLNKDDGLNNTSNAQVNGDFESEYTRNVQDQRHRIAFSGTFDTPYWLGKIRFSPLFRAGSSAPFSIGIGGSDRNLDDLGTDRPNYNGNLADIVWQMSGAPLAVDLFNHFSLPTIGSKGGNLPRNAGIGPGFYTFDTNFSRDFRLSERLRLRPNIQIDNILNAAVFNFGASFIDYGSQNGFLVPTRTFRQRQIRLGMRFDF